MTRTSEGPSEVTYIPRSLGTRCMVSVTCPRNLNSEKPYSRDKKERRPRSWVQSPAHLALAHGPDAGHGNELAPEGPPVPTRPGPLKGTTGEKSPGSWGIAKEPQSSSQEKKSALDVFRGQRKHWPIMWVPLPARHPQGAEAAPSVGGGRVDRKCAGNLERGLILCVSSTGPQGA